MRTRSFQNLRTATALGGLLLAFGPSSRAIAEPAKVGALLRDPTALVQWMAEKSPEVRAARAKVSQAHADLGTSGLFQNPSLSFSLSDIPLGPTNPPGLGFSDTAIYSLGLTETVELGKRGPRIASARYRWFAEQESYLDTLAQRVAEARLALGKVAYLKSRQTVFSESLENAKKVLEVEKSRVDHGDLSANDYDRLMLDTISIEVEVTRNSSELDAARSACSALVLAECEAEDADFKVLATALDIPESGNLGERPDLRALGFGQKSAEEDARLAGRKLIPDPTLGVGITQDKLVISGDQPRTLSLSVSIPLPTFDRGQHDQARAEAKASELDQTARGLLERAKGDLDGQMKKRVSLEGILKDLGERAVPRSATVLETTLKAFNSGQVSLTNLLLARRSHTSLMLSVLDLSFEVFTSRSELRRILGADSVIGRGLSPELLASARE